MSKLLLKMLFSVFNKCLSTFNHHFISYIGVLLYRCFRKSRIKKAVGQFCPPHKWTLKCKGIKNRNTRILLRFYQWVGRKAQDQSLGKVSAWDKKVKLFLLKRGERGSLEILYRDQG